MPLQVDVGLGRAPGQPGLGQCRVDVGEVGGGQVVVVVGEQPGLLLVVSEALVVILTVLRRSAAVVDRSGRARLLTTLSMIGPPLVRPATLQALAPETLTVLLSAAGLP